MFFENFRTFVGAESFCSSNARADQDLGYESSEIGVERSFATSRNVALVGHSRQQADLLTRLLVPQGYQISTMDAWPERIDEAAAVKRVDLIVLDLAGVIGDSGAALIARMRTHVSGAPPILVLADELAEGVVASLYEAGADDVMSKPLSVAVFSARLQALARRVYSGREFFSDLLTVGSYTIDLAARQLSLNGQLIRLSSREYDLALYLFRNVGRLVSRATLEKVIWGRELGIDSKTVDTHVYRLRVKLRLQPENGLQLASVYAQGFRLIQVVPMD